MTEELSDKRSEKIKKAQEAFNTATGPGAEQSKELHKQLAKLGKSAPNFGDVIPHVEPLKISDDFVSADVRIIRLLMEILDELKEIKGRLDSQ